MFDLKIWMFNNRDIVWYALECCRHLKRRRGDFYNGLYNIWIILIVISLTVVNI
jgi:hypothetical protein